MPRQRPSTLIKILVENLLKPLAIALQSRTSLSFDRRGQFKQPSTLDNRQSVFNYRSAPIYSAPVIDESEDSLHSARAATADSRAEGNHKGSARQTFIRVSQTGNSNKESRRVASNENSTGFRARWENRFPRREEGSSRDRKTPRRIILRASVRSLKRFELPSLTVRAFSFQLSREWNNSVRRDSTDRVLRVYRWDLALATRGNKREPREIYYPGFIMSDARHSTPFRIRICMCFCVCVFFL